MPAAPSEWLGGRVLNLAGAELDGGAHWRAAMMRPCGENLKTGSRIPIK